MKKFQIILIVSSFAFLISCSSIPKTVCPEEAYSNLNNIPIYLTTKNAVTLIDRSNNSIIKSNGALKNRLLEEYKVENKLINTKFGKYYSEIKFTNIKKIEFDGIYDKEVGIIDRTELKNKMGYNEIFYGILFGVVGLYAGFGTANLIYPFRLNDNNSVAIGWLGAIIGSAFGGIIGYNIGFKSELNLAIGKIKKERIKKTITLINKNYEKQ